MDWQWSPCQDDTCRTTTSLNKKNKGNLLKLVVKPLCNSEVDGTMSCISQDSHQSKETKNGLNPWRSKAARAQWANNWHLFLLWKWKNLSGFGCKYLTPFLSIYIYIYVFLCVLSKLINNSPSTTVLPRWTEPNCAKAPGPRPRSPARIAAPRSSSAASGADEGPSAFGENTSAVECSTKLCSAKLAHSSAPKRHHW